MLLAIVFLQVCVVGYCFPSRFVLLAIVFLAGLCCWLLFSWLVCVVGYCFPRRFVLLAIVFLQVRVVGYCFPSKFVLLAIVFLAGLCCWLLFS